MYIYRACKLCSGSFFKCFRIFAPASGKKKTAGIVLCQPVLFFICFSFFVSYLPDMALWTKGTFQKDLTQVFESRLHLTLTYLLNGVQTEWRD